MAALFTIFRTITYAALFIAFVLIYLPSRVLSWTGLARPAAMGGPQILGIVLGSAGAVIAVSSIATFAWIGKGTPAPFDPPRRLVIRGPYRFVRNPMYIGAVLALAGAALFYTSAPLLAYSGLLLLAAHLFVVFYEEPTLRRSFGLEYEAYCHRVRRWWPSARPVHSR
jgi:protein-S-isoprenylcysteine O-methyltransferase Ste14